MSVDKNTLQKIAHLARLEVTPSEEGPMINHMNKILVWMDVLNAVDTEGVQPLVHMSQEVNVLREDVVLPGLSHTDALKNAPKKDSDYFRVPKVLE